MRTKHIIRTKEERLELMFDQQVRVVNQIHPNMEVTKRMDLAAKRTKNLYLARKKAELK